MARRWQRIKGVLISAIALCVFCGPVPHAIARNYPAPTGTNAQGQGTIAAAQVPREAGNTLNLFAAGGPYPYEKDGVVFGNRERLLPPNRRGFYHEYTVPTPRSRSRGARRIVCGGPLKRTDNCYYSDDHYTSFNRIVE